MTANNIKQLRIRSVLYGYFVGFCISWFTQIIFWRISGSRGSLLAFVLMRCEEFLRVGGQRIISGAVVSYPPSAYSISVVLASFLVAVPIAGICWMATSRESRILRWAGYGAVVLLSLMTFYWPAIPRDLF
jgi:hypothetical protein